MLDPVLIKQFALKYIWWKAPDEAVKLPHRVIAQVMNIGDYQDVELLAQNIKPELLQNILKQAEAGQFNERSWTYWHYRLNMAEPEAVPPLPIRSFK